MAECEMRGVCGGNLEQLTELYFMLVWRKYPKTCLEDPILPVASFPVDVEEVTPILHIGNVVLGARFDFYAHKSGVQSWLVTWKLAAEPLERK